MVRATAERIDSSMPLFHPRFGGIDSAVDLEQRKKGFLLSIKGGKK